MTRPSCCSSIAPPRPKPAGRATAANRLSPELGCGGNGLAPDALAGDLVHELGRGPRSAAADGLAPDALAGDLVTRDALVGDLHELGRGQPRARCARWRPGARARHVGEVIGCQRSPRSAHVSPPLAFR